jgi:hypothetical protein
MGYTLCRDGGAARPAAHELGQNRNQSPRNRPSRPISAKLRKIILKLQNMTGVPYLKWSTGPRTEGRFFRPYETLRF